MGTDNSTKVHTDEFITALDNVKEQAADRAQLNHTLIGGTVGVSTGLSVGYLLWLIRGGTLMGSVLSSLPAWRFVDPLPVLNTLGGHVQDDEESLESLVDQQTPTDSTFRKGEMR